MRQTRGGVAGSGDGEASGKQRRRPGQGLAGQLGPVGGASGGGNGEAEGGKGREEEGLEGVEEAPAGDAQPLARPRQVDRRGPEVRVRRVARERQRAARALKASLLAGLRRCPCSACGSVMLTCV